MEAMVKMLEQSIGSAIVLGIFLIVTKWIDTKREERQATLNKQFVSSINKISSFLEDVTNNIINKEEEKCRASINNALEAFEKKLIVFFIQTIINNNIIDNKANIIENVNHFINAEFYRVHLSIYPYVIKGVRASDYLKEHWKNELIEDTISCIYNDRLSSNMKIASYISRINVRSADYIVYINNKLFK